MNRLDELFEILSTSPWFGGLEVTAETLEEYQRRLAAKNVAVRWPKVKVISL